MSYPLADYKADTCYVLKIKSAEKSTLTVRYYTSDSVSGYKAQASADKIRHSWKVNDKSAYSGYYVSVYKGNSPKPELQTRIASEDVASCEMNASELSSGEYTARLVPYKVVSHKEYLGKGMDYNFTYVKKPAKVVGVTVTPDTNSAKISWAPVPGASHYQIYMSSSASGKYSLAQDNVKATVTMIQGLQAGKKYFFKVRAVAKYKDKTKQGKQSAAKSAVIPIVAGKVLSVKTGIDSSDNLILKWKATKYATGYSVFYKIHTKKEYKKLGTTEKTRINLKKLTKNTKYDIIVYAQTKKEKATYTSATPSDVLQINPVKDVNKVLARKVRTIKYIGSSKEVYTSKKYSTRVKTAFVNYKGYKSSTRYLIWISHYTQQVSIFKGKKGKWKMIRTFTVATGRAKSRSPRGVFKIGKKETGWYYVSTKVLYVTHYCGKNSFHTRPLWNSGGVSTSTIGRPASHGCVRCPNEDAKYIYNNMPRGTTVVSY